MFRQILTSLAVMAVSFAVCHAQLPVDDGLQLWLDASDADTIVMADNCVEEWTDKSGNDFSAFLPLESATACPTYSVDAMNGQPAVRFNSATADGMEVIDFFQDERPYTAFIVNQYWGETRGRTLQGADSNWLLGLWAGNVSHFAGGFAGSNPPALQDFVYVTDVVGTETESFLYSNGEDITASTAPLGSPGGLGLVGAGQFPGELSDADIAEVIFYDRALAPEELTSVRNYLYEKYDSSAFAIQQPDSLNLIEGAIGTFASAADLDFEGDFVHAINLGGSGEDEFGDPLVIGDAQLLDGTNEFNDDLLDVGIDITVANEIAEWHAPAYPQDTDDDANLAFAMRSIRWNVPPGLDVSLPVEEGESYKLQLLFAESCCDRGFDITIEDELAVDNIVVQVEQGGVNNQEQGVVYTHELVAGDGDLNISLGGGVLGVPDNNPILSVLTLEQIEAIAVEPTCNPNTGGDLDGSGTVDFADFLLLSAGFGQENVTGAGHEMGDIDCSGAVDFADFLSLSANFGQDVAGAQSVPEPASHMTMLVACLIGAMVRRRRNG